jgi:hypothetical protein
MHWPSRFRCSRPLRWLRSSLTPASVRAPSCRVAATTPTPHGVYVPAHRLDHRRQHYVEKGVGHRWHIFPVGWDESPVRAKREGHQSARFNPRELRALVQVNMHAAPITIAKAKTPIATIEPAIMMNQALGRAAHNRQCCPMGQDTEGVQGQVHRPSMTWRSGRPMQTPPRGVRGLGRIWTLWRLARGEVSLQSRGEVSLQS